MRTFACVIGATLLTLSATTAMAQPGRPDFVDRPGLRVSTGGASSSANPIFATADFLLGHTGDLALTDAQVVRLAAISRRVDGRRTAMAARMDSVRMLDRARPDSGGPGGRPAAPRAELQQMRDQQRADVRDAIAVLTPDQQATAWLMIASHGPLGGGPGGPGGRMGFRVSGDEAVGPPDRGSISRPPAARDVPRRPPGTEQVTP